MFWEVWRNVTLATSNWGLGNSANKKARSNTKSTKKLRYDQLKSSTLSISSGGVSGPKKSVSQPVNLSQFITDEDIQGDHESVVPFYNNANAENEAATPISQVAPTDQTTSASGNEGVSKKAGIVKRSISSFFPFTSCTSNGSSMVKTQRTENKKKGTLANEKGNNPLDDPSSRDQLNPNKAYEGVECGGDDIIDYWDDEGLELPSCDVCARVFPTIRQLAAHQRKKRHYGCIQCDSIFPSREILEIHREQMCHYDYAIDMYSVDERELDDELDFFESEDECAGKGRRGLDDHECEDWEDEEMERLL